MTTLAARVDLLRLFGDPTRVRLTALLEREELSVAEITRITDLPQSRVSTHLGKLKEAGVLRDRRHGASTFYAMNDGAMPPEVKKLWTLVAAGLEEPVLRGDRERCQSIVRARRNGGGWPDSVAGEMERHYSPGRTWEATTRGLLGLLRLGDVLDAGSGDGALAGLLAPRARAVTCLDRSPKVLEAARRRLAEHPNVSFAPGDVMMLPFPAASFDHVLFLNVLAYAEDPARAVVEAARVLRPGGDLAIITLASHQHPEITAAYGHQHAGFAPRRLRAWLEAAGLDVFCCEITSRERQPPHFDVLTASARKGSVTKGRS